MEFRCGCVICQEGKLRLGALAFRRLEKSTLLEVSASVGGTGEGLHREVGSLAHRGGLKLNGDIVIEAKKKALGEAKKYRAGNVFWVDGSKLSHGNAGAAACWKDKNHNRWENKSVFLGKNKQIIDAELWAIAIGLETAGKITLDCHQTPITIFSDSTEALNTLCRSYPQTKIPCLRDLICQKTSDLKTKGHSVTLRWIPSHAGLVGHDKADQSARNKAQRGGKPVEQWSSLTHIKKHLTESHFQELTKVA